MRIAILAAGAGGMYCGSCMRDNALAAALIRAGHQTTLVPLYTPLRTDRPDVSIDEVFFGGLNVYLQHASRLFRRTPRVVDWLFDRPWLLRAVGAAGASTDPARLGPLTLDVLAGEDGPERKEIRRLVAFLRRHVQPDVVSLPNAMFLGAARTIGRELNAAVVCELTGEDVFLDALADPFGERAWRAIRDRAADVACFVATSRYYAAAMAERLGLPSERIEVVPPSVSADAFVAPPPRPADRPPTVGYLARVCREKGIDRLIDAMARLRRRPGFEGARLLAAGWLGRGERKWFARLAERARAGGPDAFDYLGEIDFAAKLAMLGRIDVLSVPTAYAEPKGTYVLESLAAGVPVVQPAHGAFPELIEATGGGLLVSPSDPAALADGLAELLTDHDRRAQLGAAGRAAVREGFTDARLAERMLAVFSRVAAR